MTLKDIQNMDFHPFTGRFDINPPIKARISDTEHIRHFFDGSEGYTQVDNLTIGKVYEIYAFEGFGDVSDVFVKGDNGKEKEVMSDWFDEVQEF